MKIRNICVYNMYPAILGIRNSFKSKGKSDSFQNMIQTENNVNSFNHCKLGQTDKKLVKNLLKKGNKDPEYCNQERKFLRQILVSMDIVGSIKFWAQMDTFKISTVRNSESTMHSITKGFLEQSDFEKPINPVQIKYINLAIIEYNSLKDLDKRKEIFEIIDANLPGGYVLESHWTGNYENLRNIYYGRKNHKMYWWHEFISYIEKLPYFELLIKGE